MEYKCWQLKENQQIFLGDSLKGSKKDILYFINQDLKVVFEIG